MASTESVSVSPVGELPPAGSEISALEVLRWGRGLTEPALREAVDRLPEPMRRIAGYHFGWWDAQGHPIGEPSGKALRPALVLLSARAVGAEAEVALPAAVAVELVHNFSLIHDDVMDGDLSRRHRPTVWYLFGSGPAILAGDAMLTLAHEVLNLSGHAAANEGITMMASTVQALIEGQSHDLAFEDRDEVSLGECMRMAHKKTGTLLGCACALGAAFGGADPERVESFRAFGHHLGLAFQIVDDLLGIWGDPAVTGKPVHADLMAKKKSLPVAAALSSATGASARLAALYRGEGELSPSEAAMAAEFTEMAGARHWGREQARQQVRLARDQLTRASAVDPALSELLSVADLVTTRDH